MIKWQMENRDDNLTVAMIVKRARNLGSMVDAMTINMDITAAHLNGCSLDLKGLLEAKQSDFVHDVYGIIHNIDRKTGEIQNHFTPRFALEQ